MDDCNYDQAMHRTQGRAYIPVSEQLLLMLAAARHYSEYMNLDVIMSTT